MRILITKLAALGDVLRTTSLLKPLRVRHPGCEIWWATSRAAMPLLARNPYLHRIIDLDSLEHLPARVRFDLALSLEEDPRAAELAAQRCRGSFVGVYAEYGRLRYTNSSAPYYAMSLLNSGADGSLKTADALKAKNRRTYAELWLKVLDLPEPKRREDLRPVLVLADSDRRAARTLAKRQGLKPGAAIGVNPGAGRRWSSKQLSPERAAALLDALHRRFRRPLLLFGGPDESARNRDILRRTSAPVIDAGVRHGLREFAGLIELCGLLVTTDTLALHVGAAVGVPIVALVGPTSAAELDAFGRGRILAAPRCACFYRPRCRLARSCLDRLPESGVLAATAESLRKRRFKARRGPRLPRPMDTDRR